MNTLNPTQVERFKALFPELPEDLADVVLLYAAGATQADKSPAIARQSNALLTPAPPSRSSRPRPSGHRRR